MFNPLNVLPLWRALRHFSLTFALVFAAALLGVSVNSHLRRLFDELPVPFFVVWIAPTILLGLLAKYERRWLPDEALRRRIAWSVVLGAIMLFAVLFTFRRMTAPPPPPDVPVAPSGPVRRGPAGK